MVYASAPEGGYGAGASVIYTDASHAESINVPNAELLFRGHFHRAGPDLVLTGHDGRHHLIPGYFAGEKLPALVAPNGARLSPDLVDLLAGSPTPGEYAQAQPTAPRDAVGKVEKVVGDVTVMRNGVAVALHVGDAVYKSDVIQTGANSSVGIGFPDGTALNLVPNTRMALNEYSYDPNGTSNGALFSLVEGTFAFVAGKVAHTGGMNIETPVATMGIRGTTGWVQEQVATITATLGNVTYSFAVVDDLGTNSHGQYDLIDQNGNVIAAVSQTGYLTFVTSQGPNLPPLVTTLPMTNSQLGFEQAIVQDVFQTLNLINNPNPQSAPNPGSSTPPDELHDLPHLLQENGGTQFAINIEIVGPGGPTLVAGTANITVPPQPPPAPSTVEWTSQSSGTWETAPDWNINAIPGTQSTVEINLPVKVTVNEAETVGGLVIGTGATLNIADGGTLTISNEISNAGLIQLNSSGVDPTLAIDGTVYLLGGGKLDMLGPAAENLIIGVAESDATLINANNAIIGSGTIGLGDGALTLVNGVDGVIEALNGTLILNLGSVVNNSGVFAAASGATLKIEGAVDNDGTIAAQDGGTLQFDSVTVNNTGVVELNAENVPEGSPTYLVIDGTLTLQGGDGGATGPGQIVLTDSGDNYIQSDGSAAQLINVDNAISGAGTIGDAHLTLDNEQYGVIEADGSNPLIIDTGTNAITNAGLMEASHNAVLEIESTVDNSGTIAAQDGGTLQFDNVTVNNTGAVELNAKNMPEGSPTYLVIDGTLTLQGGDGVATGPGQIVLTDSGDNYIQSDGSAAQLINVDNTISGAGTIGDAHLTLDNEQYGVIEANGSNPLVLNTGANTIINDGTLVANGGTLDVDSSVSGDGTVTITGGGIADFANTFNQDVTLVGAGTLALAHSQANGYTGAVSGFSAGDAIDLTDLTYSPTETDIWNSADGTLTIDNGAQTETLSLAGTYTQDNFALTQDSGTGTEIVFSPTQVTLEGLNNDGNAVDGQPITVNLTDAELNDVTYTWLVGGQVVEGVTGNSYTPTGADDGKTLDVLVNFVDPLTQVVEHDTALAGAVVGEGFLDQTITYQYLYPTANSSYYETTIAVGSGTTHSGIYSGSTDIGNFTVDANQITFNFTSTGVLNNTSYNGWDIYEPGVSIVGFAVESSSDVAGLSNAMLSFDAHDLYVNWAGLSFLAGGTVTFNVTFDPPLDAAQLNIAQTLDGSGLPANNSGTLTIADGTELALAGTIDNTGAIAVDGGSAATAIGINGNVMLQGGGEIDFTDSNQNYIFGDGTLINIDNTISGSGDLGNGTLIFDNAGVIETNGSYALIIDTGANPFVNTGTLETDGGTLIVNSPVSGGGNAIIAGGTLEFSGASNNNVSFSGGNAGVLALDQSQDFTGNISGFGGQDQIDLGDIGFTANTTLNYAVNNVDAGGILTLSDGTHTTELCLVGNYTASSFAISSDGHGGTLLTDPSATIASSNPSIASLSAADATGTITFADADTSDAQTAVVTPEGSGYVGSFSLDSVSESNGSVSVGWQFQLGNDQINLALGQTETQSYGVTVADGQDAVANETVSVSIGGPGNDNFVFHPGVGADTIVNFNAQVDTIELDHFANAQSIQQLASMITSDAHGDAVIDLGHNDSIIIPGVTANYLQAHLQSLVHLI